MRGATRERVTDPRVAAASSSNKGSSQRRCTHPCAILCVERAAVTAVADRPGRRTFGMYVSWVWHALCITYLTLPYLPSEASGYLIPDSYHY